MAISKNLEEVFDIDESEFESSNTKEVANYTEPGVPVVPMSEDEVQELTDDFNLARNSLRSALTNATDLIEDSIQLAKELDKPSAYDAAANLFRTISDLSKDLIEIHNKRAVRKGQIVPENGGDNTTVNNAMFVGTTSDLMDLLNNHKKTKEKDVN